MSFSISIQAADFDVGHEYIALVNNDSTAGAVVFFVGRVRDRTNDQQQPTKQIVGLELEHYPGMTEKQLMEIIETAKARWLLNAVRIVHRVGRLGAGEQIVFVGVSSAHRAQAFSAAEFLMDFLKTRAPFWKKEFYSDESYSWVAAKEKDEDAAKRWGSN